MKPSDEQEHDAEEQRHGRDRLGREDVADRCEIRLAREAEDPGDAIDEEARAHRAEDEILHPGFERCGIPPHISHKDVETDGD